MTLLTICADAADEIGITRPSSITGSQEPTDQKLFRYAKKEGRELLKRGYWQGVRQEQTFTTLAQETQTAMIPADFDRFVNETFWNRTRRRPLLGPVTPQQWQNLKAWTSSPVQDTFIIRGSDVLIDPAPPAGETLAFEYISSYYCTDSGGTPISVWTADTDLPRLPEELFILGIKWRFLEGEGLPFENALANYEAQVRQALTGDTAKRTVNMAARSPYGSPRPGIVVPEGDWSV
jgi:hypothetical protein